VTSATGPLLGRAPRFVRSLLTFPYAPGLGFVHQFRRRHGWAALSRVYADPPRSTTQILHPERYLERREDPVPVTLPDLGALLGGARLVIDDVAGEFGFAGILSEGLGETAPAAGWRGDRYGVWDGGAAAAILVSLSAWESDAAAGAFAEAYGRVLQRKHGPPASPGTAWTAAGRMFGMERRGTEVLLFGGVPAATLETVRRAIWQTRS
jgi:hypothetical protein